MILKLLAVISLLPVGLSAATTETQTHQDESWQKIAPVGRSFTVLMPTRAAQSTRLVSFSERDSIPVVVYQVLSNGKRYLAAEFYKPTSDYAALSSFENFVASMEQGLKGDERTQSLEFERDLSLAGMTGKQYRMKLNEHTGVARFFGSRNTFYALMVIGADETDVDAARFLSSFNPGEVNTNADASGVTTGVVKIVGSAAPTVPQTGGSLPPEPWPIMAPINGGVLNGKATELGRPEYPLAAREQGDAGTVKVQILIDELGSVIHAEAIEGPLSLREAAVRAAWKSRFTQTRLSGQPVKVAGVLVYNFVRQ